MRRGTREVFCLVYVVFATSPYLPSAFYVFYALVCTFIPTASAYLSRAFSNLLAQTTNWPALGSDKYARCLVLSYIILYYE